MKYFLTLLFASLLCACDRTEPITSSDSAPEAGVVIDPSRSVIRVNSTTQSWNAAQPWEKTPPERLRSLGALVGPHEVLTTAEMVANATYLELELPDGSKVAEAEIIAVDYEANLALLTLKSEEDAANFFAETQPLPLAPPPSISDSLQVVQIEENGTTLLTSGTLQAIDVSPSFLPRQAFLTYLVKASMQSAASSFSLPVVKEGALAGILLSYDSEDQISDVLSVDVISHFLREAAAGAYFGFPVLGITTANTEDPSFRKFLKLEPDQGGIYISEVRKDGAADLAGIKKGDVILTAGGFPIDRRGYYQDPNYGSVFWSHLIRGEKSTGEAINLSILRNGEPLKVEATLTRQEPQDRLVPEYQFDRPPNFLVKGGLIFQELNRPLLEAFGENWTSRAPLNLLDVYENPEKYREHSDRIIFLSGSIPTPATVGYESLRNLIVQKVNGVKIDNMKTLVKAFDNPGEQNLHSIEFIEEEFTLFLDETISSQVDSMLLQRGLTRLHRAD